MFDKRDHIYIIAIRVKRLHVENKMGKGAFDTRYKGNWNW